MPKCLLPFLNDERGACLTKVVFIPRQIQKARDEAEQLRQDAEAAVQASMALEDEFDPDKRQRKYNIKNPEQVLVRLKVEHSGFTTLNNQRFGSRFVGEVVSFAFLFTLIIYDARRCRYCVLKTSNEYSSTNRRILPIFSYFTKDARPRLQRGEHPRRVVSIFPRNLMIWTRPTLKI